MPRCNFTNCKRKLPLTVTTCRCNLQFCDIHRMPEEHTCVYDYKGEGRKEMEKMLSSIVFTKKELILESI